MKRDENQTVEYKESWHEKYLEWICGYANAKGGTLYIGIEDGTKRTVGVKNVNKLMEDIPNCIRNTMGIVADGALSRQELMEQVGLRDRKSFYGLYLLPSLDIGFIEYTIPGKPNSRLQKYRITAKGRAELRKNSL